MADLQTFENLEELVTVRSKINEAINTIDNVADGLSYDANTDTVTANNLTILNDINVTFGDLEVAGNLVVSGTFTTISTEQLTVEDPVFVINSDQLTPNADIGVILQRYDVANTTNWNIGLIWDEDSKTFVVGKTPEDGADNETTISQSLLSVTDAGLLTVDTANISSLIATNGTITSLDATSANVASADIEYAIIANTDIVAANVDLLLSNNATIQSSTTNTANIWFLSVDNDMSVNRNFTANNVDITASANIAGSLTVVGDVSGANASFNNAILSGALTATSVDVETVNANNITAVSVGTFSDVQATSITASDITANTFSIVDDLVLTANLVANNATINGSVTISGTTSVVDISASGDIDATGNVSAAYFIGDGSQLTNIADTTTLSSLSISNHDQITVLANGNIGVGGNTTPFYSLVSDSNIQAAAFYGDGSNLTGLPTLISLGIENHDLVAVDAAGNMTANSFTGDGSQLTGINTLTEADAIALAIALG